MLGAPEKAIIFTESTRTQGYLQTLLSEKEEYRDNIVALPTFKAQEGVRKTADLGKPEIRKAVLEKVERQLEPNLFSKHIMEEAAAIYETVVTDYRNNIIEIPRMDLVQLVPFLLLKAET